jgi:hypothetical protein
MMDRFRYRVGSPLLKFVAKYKLPYQSTYYTYPIRVLDDIMEIFIKNDFLAPGRIDLARSAEVEFLAAFGGVEVHISQLFDIIFVNLDNIGPHSD